MLNITMLKQTNNTKRHEVKTNRTSRTANHRLPVGKWQNIKEKIRKYLFCETTDIGDEFHYIIQCRYFEQSPRTSSQDNLEKGKDIPKYNYIIL